MGAFFIYILKSSVCLVLFYLFYRVLLSKETFHRFNRVALLGVLCFSLLIPCIEITTRHQVEVQHAVLSIEQLLMMAEAETTLPVEIGEVSVEETAISWIQIVLLIYLLGIVVLSCRNIYSLFNLLKLIRSGKREKMEKGVTLVVHEQQVAPFSWMRYIVISRKDLEENGREILIHEMAHIRNRHSVDLLVADVCIFFQWFNPGAWLLKQELQNIHEYEADETVINEGVNAKEYQLLLIKKAVGTRLYSMANSFNHSKLKKRITMMLKEKSNPWARLKYLYVLPLAAVAVTAFARPEISDKAEEISAVKVNDLAAIVETKVEEITKGSADAVVPRDSLSGLKYSGDSIAEFTENGRKDSMIVFGARIEMPDSIEAFILVNGKEVPQEKLDEILKTEEGQAQIKNVTVIEKETALPIYGEKGKNGVMNIQLLPEDDTHFKVTMTKAKIRSKADTSTVVKTISLRNVKGMPIRGVEGKEEPLYIIDGEEVAGPNPLAKIDRDRIESFSVLQKETATTIYGEKGKNGAVLVELKPDDGSQSIEKTQENPSKNAWEDAMDLNGPDKVSTKKVVFYVNGKETSEEEMKQISVDEIHGIQKKISVKNDETIILINTDQSTDKWTTAWGTVEDKAGKPIEGAKVVIYGTDTGTVTDAKGYYKLRTPTDATIQVSFGPKSVTRVTARENVIIRLDR